MWIDGVLTLGWHPPEKHLNVPKALNYVEQDENGFPEIPVTDARLAASDPLHYRQLYITDFM